MRRAKEKARKEKRIKILIGILIFIIGMILMIAAIPFARQFRENPALIGSEIAIPIGLEVLYLMVLSVIKEAKNGTFKTKDKHGQWLDEGDDW